MSKTFIIEAVMLAVHGQLMLPGQPVTYIIPYTSIQELYELQAGSEPIMLEEEDDGFVKQMIGELIAFFEESFNKKKIEKALVAPWRKSPPLPINEHVTLMVVLAIDTEAYGEQFDPIETELILSSMKEQAPILTDQFDLIERLIQAEIPVQAFDVEDFEFAVEGDNLV
ncbi:ADP-heptose synthase [Paenibacillus sp. CGMCC 1.16610]|uniref:ADP-heptose synthase n=1 Tax=Paenibacillus anseongense TaxID=2682845 RepID=A0ABW9UA09_9BACL|nr:MULTISPECIES: ADP-heptose synthase [Paenibacillus]MBA2937740.1 ADP-heptose synthase [Paenibacillus sp. CGMCC 1.16610]MVQ36798.1 ADP-heptose synthase [Paenibacillus anseongense]